MSALTLPHFFFPPVLPTVHLNRRDDRNETELMSEKYTKIHLEAKNSTIEETFNVPKCFRDCAHDRYVYKMGNGEDDVQAIVAYKVSQEDCFKPYIEIVRVLYDYCTGDCEGADREKVENSDEAFEKSLQDRKCKEKQADHSKVTPSGFPVFFEPPKCFLECAEKELSEDEYIKMLSSSAYCVGSGIDTRNKLLDTCGNKCGEDTEKWIKREKEEYAEMLKHANCTAELQAEPASTAPRLRVGGFFGTLGISLLAVSMLIFA